MIAVNIVGASVLSVMLLFIFMKKGKNSADYWLIAVIGLLASYFVVDLWIQHGLSHTNFIIRSLMTPILFACFLTYGALLLEEDHRLKIDYIWFWVYAMAWTLFTIVDFSISGYTTIELKTIYNTPPRLYKWMLVSHDLYNVGALIWLLKNIYRYDRQLKNNYSYLTPFQLQWLKNFVYIYLSIKVIAFIAWALLSIDVASSIDEIRPFFNVIFVGMMVYLSYHGIRQYTLAQFYEYDPASRRLVRNYIRTQKYESSTMTNDDLKELQSEIDQVFQAEKLYLNPELKVHDLAAKLEVTAHKISQTLNSIAGLTFYDYVNKYRVDQLKKLLADPDQQQFTILGLGFDSGFNSKASMNRIFKQQVGMTPKAYQQSQAKKAEA